MLRFYRNILLLAIPVAFLLITLKPDGRLIFKALKDDCLNKGMWLFDRSHINPEPIDILFLGSSRTINAINDKQLDSNWLDRDLHTVNYGYCRLGRNLHYSLLKDILKNKKPQMLVLEVRAAENPYSHPIFPYLAVTKDVIRPLHPLHEDVLDDGWEHMKFKLELEQDALFNRQDSLHIFPWNNGHRSAPDTIENLPQLSFNYDQRSMPAMARSYLLQIAKLCHEKQIQLVFCYIPNLPEIKIQPQHAAFYRQHGTLLIPPIHLMEDPDHWHDIDHVNSAGSVIYTQWIGSEIEELL